MEGERGGEEEREEREREGEGERRGKEREREGDRNDSTEFISILVVNDIISEATVVQQVCTVLVINTQGQRKTPHTHDPLHTYALTYVRTYVLLMCTHTVLLWDVQRRLVIKKSVTVKFSHTQ